MIACITLAAAALAVTLRWTLLRVDALGRPRQFPRVMVAVPAFGAALCLIPMIAHMRLEDRLAKAASAVTAMPVTVRCETVDQAWLDVHPERGYVAIDPDGKPQRHAVITYDTCNDLSAWLASDKQNPTDAQVLAVHVLGHEAMHMAGLVAEPRAECAAVQRDAHLAQALGATPAQARRLARHYWLVDYHDLPDSYRDPGCVAGGALDEHLTDSPWTELGAADPGSVANAPTAQLRQVQPAGSAV